MIKHLVQLGADVNARDVQQRTPLHHALCSRIDDKAELVMKDIILSSFGEEEALHELQRNCKLKLALMNMIEKEKINLIDCLLDLGADINAKFNRNVTSLSEAVRMKNVQAVEILANLGVFTSSQTLLILGFTAFSEALQHREEAVMKHLVHKGADVNASLSLGQILHEAVQSRNLQMVQALLEHGMDVDEVKLTNVTAVIYCILNKITDPGCYSCLTNLGADFSLPYTQSSAIHEAVTLQEPDILDCLLRHGADVHSKKVKMTPILIASTDKDTAMLEHLVRCGAKINATYDVSCHIVAYPARKGKTVMIKALLSHGAQLDHPILKGITALYSTVLHAIENSSFEMIEVIKMLISLGADVNMKYGVVSMLDDAVTRSDVDMVKMLCSFGVDVNSTQKRWANLLIHPLLVEKTYECSAIAFDIMKLLVEAGADLNARHNYSPALFLSIERSDTAMVQTLAALGANMERCMRHGMTPLHEASQHDETDTLEYLLEKGANPNAEYIAGVDPLLHAIQLGDVGMVHCLLRCGAYPLVGEYYTYQNALIDSVMSNHTEMSKCLIKAGANLKEHILGYIPPDDKTVSIAKRFHIDIPGIWLSQTLLSYCILVGGNAESVEMILSLGKNQQCTGTANRISTRRLTNNTISSAHRCLNSFGIYLEKNELVTCDSDVRRACCSGDLDIVRLLIIDGADINERSPRGTLPLETLPLASYVDDHTLQETRTAEKVVESVGMENVPYVSCQSMESLLCCPGIGNVQSIHFPNVTDIHKGVHEAMCWIAERCNSFTKLGVIGVGSAGEGTKVGLPDEMDFLAEVTQLGSKDRSNLKTAGHDYVYYFNQASHSLKDGSKTFHAYFRNELVIALHNLPFPSRLRFVFMGQDFAIKDTNRRATSPFRICWNSTNEQEFLLVPMSVDAVPCLLVNDWPEGAISKTWLLGTEELKQHGYYLVPKPPNARSELAKEYTPRELRILWKISFAHLETYHMQRLDNRVKDVYLLAKCLRNPDVCRVMVTDEGSYPRNTDKFITSYMLKMIFFKNVEDFLRSDMSLGEMVCRVYDGVEEGLSQGFIPLYFMPKVNALGGHKLNIAKCTRVARIVKKFVHALYLRDCQRDLDETEDMEVTVYQRQPKSVYRSIEIGQPDEIPESKH
jgi:ankyrin repeat protein